MGEDGAEHYEVERCVGEGESVLRGSVPSIRVVVLVVHIDLEEVKIWEPWCDTCVTPVYARLRYVNTLVHGPLVQVLSERQRLSPDPTTNIEHPRVWLEVDDILVDPEKFLAVGLEFLEGLRSIEHFFDAGNERGKGAEQARLASLRPIFL